MSFEAPFPTHQIPLPKPEQLKSEGHFGNEQEIVQTLKDGAISFLGTIDSQIPGIKPSTNGVDLVSIAPSTNTVSYVSISQENEKVFGVFKPSKGENIEVKERLQLKNLFSNEAFAYQVSQHFNLEIVPPTVVRTISEDLEGSLQLFLPTSQWQSQKYAFDAITTEEYGQITQSDDWIAMALLDFLILNPDRHEDNLFIERVSADTTPRLAAIDNGNSNSVYNYNTCKLHGPTLVLTHVPGDPKERPRAVPIPVTLLEKLDKAIANKATFPIPLPKDFPDQALTPFWVRAEALLETGVVLSRHNLHYVTGSLTLGGRHPEIRAI